jgi:hypothetical protein
MYIRTSVAGIYALFNEETLSIPIAVWLVIGKVDGLGYGAHSEEQIPVDSNAKGGKYRLSWDSAQ